jgi:CubicO group peptidase (beta-lactamase class C family)
MRVVHDSIVRVLDRAIADSAFPGAIAVVGRRDGEVTSYAVGRLDWPAQSPPPDERSLWDLASLTKVVGMTTAMMQLVEQDRVELDAPVVRYLPEFAGPGKERVTIRHLLTHSSGLPSWRPLYKEATTADTAVAIVFATAPDTVPGARMVYSDLGAILLGKVVERVTGEPLDVYLTRHVFGPLGMTSTMYRPDASLRARIAPTEFDPWRQRKIHGEVHDENAFMLGGVSGHAGLFSTAGDLARFARMMLSGGTLDGVRVLRGSTIAQFTAVQDPGLSHRALGWETPSGRNSAGARMSARAFGHTGFTGTSLWMDPEAGVFVILLSNRVNPSRQNTRIGLVRTALADAVMAALGGAAPLSPSSP